MKVSMNLDSVSCSLGSLVKNSTINMVAGEEESKVYWCNR